MAPQMHEVRVFRRGSGPPSGRAARRSCRWRRQTAVEGPTHLSRSLARSRKSPRRVPVVVLLDLTDRHHGPPTAGMGTSATIGQAPGTRVVEIGHSLSFWD